MQVNLDKAVFIGYIDPSDLFENVFMGTEAPGGISVFSFQVLIKILIQRLLYGKNKTNKRQENVT